MAARSWTKLWTQAALMGALAATGALFAQQPSGSISIRLTDLYSKPLEGVVVTLRNRTTGAIERGTAARNGIYRFVRLEAGNYTLDAQSLRLGEGELDDIEITAGTESHIQAAVTFGHHVPQETTTVTADNSVFGAPTKGLRAETVLTATPAILPQLSTAEGAHNPVLSPAFLPVGIFHAAGSSQRSVAPALPAWQRTSERPHCKPYRPGLHLTLAR